MRDFGQNMFNAAHEGNCDQIESLLAAGASINVELPMIIPLHSAAFAGQEAAAALLLSKGAVVNPPAPSSNTPLHYAAIN